MPNHQLTTRQANFCKEYIEGEHKGNGTRAAELAGYKGGDKALAVTAVRLLASTKIQEHMKARQADTEQKTKVDMTILRSELLDVYREARAANDRTNANTALKMIGQTIAAFSDRVITKDDDELARLKEVERDEADKLVKLRLHQVQEGVA